MDLHSHEGGAVMLTSQYVQNEKQKHFFLLPNALFDIELHIYALAIYATAHLGQVYTMSELSEPAITGIVAVLFAKVLGNIFEHNDGPLWGKTNRDKHEEEEL